MSGFYFSDDAHLKKAWEIVESCEKTATVASLIAQALHEAEAAAVERERKELRKAVDEIPPVTWSDELVDEMAGMLEKMTAHGLIGYVRERTLQETFAGLNSVWLDRSKP